MEKQIIKLADTVLNFFKSAFHSEHRAKLIARIGFVVFIYISILIWVAIQSYDREVLSANFDNNRNQSSSIVPKVIDEKTFDVINMPILAYHSVRPSFMSITSDQKQYDVDPARFEEELTFIIEKGYTSITFSQLADYFDYGITLPSKPFILSLDDGRDSQYIYAFPIIKKLGLKATFFVYTNPIGWAPGFMTWDELREISQGGMEIGSHSVTHPYLTRSSDKELDNEVTRSKEVLERELGIKIESFAVPFGYSDKRIEESVERAGYRVGRMINGGVKQRKDDIFRLNAYIATNNMGQIREIFR